MKKTCLVHSFWSSFLWFVSLQFNFLSLRRKDKEIKSWTEISESAFWCEKLFRIFLFNSFFDSSYCFWSSCFHVFSAWSSIEEHSCCWFPNFSHLRNVWHWLSISELSNNRRSQFVALSRSVFTSFCIGRDFLCQIVEGFLVCFVCNIVIERKDKFTNFFSKELNFTWFVNVVIV